MSGHGRREAEDVEIMTLTVLVLQFDSTNYKYDNFSTKI